MPAARKIFEMDFTWKGIVWQQFGAAIDMVIFPYWYVLAY